MGDEPTYHLDTICLHGGQSPDPATGSRAVPIHQTTSFVFKDTDHAAGLFGLKEAGNIYTRISNPTADVVERRVAALEGGVGALLLASGLAAEMIAFTTLAKQGENIVSSASLYGGTKTLLSVNLPRFGIGAKFADVRDPALLRAAHRRGHPGHLRRDDRQPVRRSPRPRSVRPSRPRPQAPARRRQHLRHARPLPALRLGRRYRHPLGHQVHRRARDLDRRDHRGRRKISLGQRPVCRFRQPFAGLSRAQVLGDVRPRGLHRQVPRRGAAHARALGIALQRVPFPSGAGNPPLARGPDTATTRCAWRGSSKPIPRWPG